MNDFTVLDIRDNSVLFQKAYRTFYGRTRVIGGVNWRQPSGVMDAPRRIRALPNRTVTAERAWWQPLSGAPASAETRGRRSRGMRPGACKRLTPPLVDVSVEGGSGLNPGTRVVLRARIGPLAQR